ncbi:MAG TPA: response regulator transcription factor [Stellaceae bacterium]|nr:response regulator transcription factor [Stellaceae bacterium]
MKLLIVDDHPIVRAGLRRLLAGEPGMALREVASGKEALVLCRDERPDLVILDLNLPGLGGLEVIKRLKLEHPAQRILVLSMHDDPLYAMRALQAGATGYVAKNAAPDDILEAIRRVGAGQRYLAPSLAQDLAFFALSTPTHPLAELSRRELEILRLLGEGRSLRQIAETVGLSYKTIANTCGGMKTKLGVQRTAELIRISIENGVASES